MFGGIRTKQNNNHRINTVLEAGKTSRSGPVVLLDKLRNSYVWQLKIDRITCEQLQ